MVVFSINTISTGPLAVHAAPDFVTYLVAAVALLALFASVYLYVQLRRVRRDQQIILSDGSQSDLVSHAIHLQEHSKATLQRAEELFALQSQRLSAIESVFAGTYCRQGIVRFDAFGEQTGAQSVALALLDGAGSGFVLTVLVRRASSQIYLRQVTNGSPEHRLAPEESQALNIALSESTVQIDGTIDGVEMLPEHVG